MESDYNKGRVQDPTKIDKKHEERVKRYCKDFFDKAASKHKEREKHKAEKEKQQQQQQQPSTTVSPSAEATPADDADAKMSDNEFEPANADSTAISPDDLSSLKRKRETDLLDRPNTEYDDGDRSPSKRQKSTPPPPPPPPAPASTGDEDSKMEDEADAEGTPPTPPPPPPKESPDGSGPDGVLDPDSEMQGLAQHSQIGVESI